MTRITLRQLEHFVAAAESGTMTSAAKQSRVSQSAVSLAIAELERVLGVQLVLRHKARGLTLTAAGAQVLDQARVLLAQADGLQAAAGGLGHDLAGRLIVGCYLTLGPFMLPRILDEFGRAHPRIDVTFVEASQAELQDRLLDGGCEVALLFDMDIAPGIECIRLYTVTPHVLIAADHPLAHRRRIRLADLAGQPAIMLDQPASVHYLTTVLAQAGLTAAIRHRTTNVEMVRSLVGRNLGYSLLFQHPAAQISYEGLALVARPIADHINPMAVLLARRTDLRPTHRAEAFTDYCRQTFQAPPPGGRGAIRNSALSPIRW